MVATGTLGTVAYNIVSRDRTAAGLNSAADRAQRIGKIGMQVGAAMTAAGVGIIALTSASRTMNATLRQTSLQLGVDINKMRELAIETTNVTFPLSEVTATFDLLTRAGLTNADQIAASATAFDTLGDAIGVSASEVTRLLIPAFNAYGIPLEEAGENTDILTHLIRNTTVELSDFSGMLNFLAADLRTMDISMQDSVAVMEALAAQGIQGSAATREFRTAVTQADGDVSKFFTALGVTEAQVAKYSAEIDNSTGITQEFADAANTQFSVMDKMKQTVSELTLRFGSMLEPLEILGPVFLAAGPILIAFSAAQLSAAASGLTLSASLWAMAAPLLPFVVAGAAVAGTLVWLETRFKAVTVGTALIKTGLQTSVKILQKLAEIGKSVSDSILKSFSPVIDILKRGIRSYLDIYINSFRTILSVTETVINKVGPILAKVFDFEWAGFSVDNVISNISKLVDESTKAKEEMDKPAEEQGDEDGGGAGAGGGTFAEAFAASQSAAAFGQFQLAAGKEGGVQQRFGNVTAGALSQLGGEPSESDEAITDILPEMADTGTKTNELIKETNTKLDTMPELVAVFGQISVQFDDLIAAIARLAAVKASSGGGGGGSNAGGGG